MTVIGALMDGRRSRSSTSLATDAAGLRKLAGSSVTVGRPMADVRRFRLVSELDLKLISGALFAYGRLS